MNEQMNERNSAHWLRDAACVGEDPELFFPVGATSPAKLQAREAKEVCLGCGVRERCLEWALELGAEYGVWGGLSEDERRALQKRRSYAQKLGKLAL